MDSEARDRAEVTPSHLTFRSPAKRPTGSEPLTDWFASTSLTQTDRDR